MATEIPLAMHTAYADLVDRCAVAAFERDFAANGNFVAKTVRGRKYWYFQQMTSEGRRQKYVGPETEELLEKIARHRNALDDTRDRQALVSMLVRSAYLPRPQPKMGEVLQALAEAGVFRLRAVLVGTIAYQTYAAMLGVRLPAASVQTGDLDIAQHRTISVAAKDKTLPPLSVLKSVDASFRPVPHLKNSTRSTSYVAAGGLRVDFLTPNRGAESGEPAALPALRRRTREQRTPAANGWGFVLAADGDRRFVATVPTPDLGQPPPTDLGGDGFAARVSRRRVAGR